MVMRDPSKLADVIWSGEVGFMCEARYQDIDLPGALTAKREHVEQELLASGMLPDLSGAPIASWLLARVARLAGKHFPYSYGQVIGSDGADYWLRFYCLSRSGSPIGLLSCLGKQAGVVLAVRHLPGLEPNPLLDSFIHSLLAAPGDVSKCKVIVQYTEMSDPEVVFHIPRVYGWDGRRFLNEGAPEHAVDPKEYE